MSFIADHMQKFSDLDTQIERQDQIVRLANGGKSILFCYPPSEDMKYIEKAKEHYSEKAEFIDLSSLFVEFIDSYGWDAFSEYYQEYSITPHIVFKSDDPTTDLYDLIISSILQACKNTKIPFLVRTGCLHGTGIEIVSIMENKCVISQKFPLVILYPAKVSGNSIEFLNFKQSNPYRCIPI